MYDGAFDDYPKKVCSCIYKFYVKCFQPSFGSVKKALHKCTVLSLLLKLPQNQTSSVSIVWLDYLQQLTLTGRQKSGVIHSIVQTSTLSLTLSTFIIY